MKVTGLHFIKKHLPLLLCGGLFVLLLARNPLSERTQIPNLEPYPDSMHYIVPARSMLHGTGPYLSREGRTINPAVPIVYSLSLTPFFAVYDDPRIFYVANVLFALVSLILFSAILEKLHIHKLISFITLFLYVTNYHLYWYPSLAMAENFSLVLFLAGMWLLLHPLRIRYAVAAGILSVMFYGTKYANVNLTVMYGLLYFIKIALPVKTIRVRINMLALYVLSGVLAFLFLLGWEQYFYGKTFFKDFFEVVRAVFENIPSDSSTQPEAGNIFFSTRFIPENVRFYGRMLLGFPTKTLWVFTPLVPHLVAVVGIAGLAASAVSRTRRLFALSLLSCIAANIVFLSTFYAPDARYFLFVIPSLLFGCALLLDTLYSFLRRTKHINLAHLVFFFFIVLAVVSSAKRVKEQVGLNLRHAETPWYYISVRTFDAYLHTHAAEFAKKPVVISALPPYFVDMYAKESFILLPLDSQQEFRSNPTEAWGPHDYENLEAVYTKFLKEGHPVFLTKYGLGNEKYLQDAFTKVLTNFSVNTVSAGCYDLCTVYELTVK